MSYHLLNYIDNKMNLAVPRNSVFQTFIESSDEVKKSFP